MVDDMSAVLYLQEEERIPVNQNNTDMVKFASQADDTHVSICLWMKHCLESNKGQKCTYPSNRKNKQFANHFCSAVA